MHNTGYKSALARRVCRYSDARPPRKTDGVLLESEIPPHMRGKAEPKRLWQLSGGITPAYAGKSNLLPHTRCRSWDHPRVCGEKFRAYAMIWQEWGSPPHMRGKVLLTARWSRSMGITPAYAGKSIVHGPVESVNRDHPRICGEKSPGFICCGPCWGSPPHMRGKVKGIACTRGFVRITPAYAGKRQGFNSGYSFQQDHPRICGEK